MVATLRLLDDEPHALSLFGSESIVGDMTVSSSRPRCVVMTEEADRARHAAGRKVIRSPHDALRAIPIESDDAEALLQFESEVSPIASIASSATVGTRHTSVDAGMADVSAASGTRSCRAAIAHLALTAAAAFLVVAPSLIVAWQMVSSRASVAFANHSSPAESRAPVKTIDFMTLPPLQRIPRPMLRGFEGAFTPVPATAARRSVSTRHAGSAAPDTPVAGAANAMMSDAPVARIPSERAGPDHNVGGITRIETIRGMPLAPLALTGATQMFETGVPDALRTTGVVALVVPAGDAPRQDD